MHPSFKARFKGLVRSAKGRTDAAPLLVIGLDDATNFMHGPPGRVWTRCEWVSAQHANNRREDSFKGEEKEDPMTHGP